MANLRKLWRLQMLEEQQEKLKGKGPDLKVVEQLKGLKKEIEDTKNTLKELKAHYQQTKHQETNLSQEAQKINDQCGLVSTKIYDGSLHTKEIKTYQQRLDKLKAELIKVEDRELEILQQREDIKTQWEEKKQSLDNLTEKFKELQQVYLQQKEEIKTRALDLAREISELIEEIEENQLNQYRQLKAKYKNPVSRITKDACSGCHLSIPFDKLKQLKYQEAVVCCNHCGRMIFWDPA